ncbi:DUF4907 domain-containing protein [Formosa sp. 3Alg 14/1]|uniref:DUF4907 domain-containing protein n=1 Tax=Formosa sp. 3Alg 14/1 TaxID=3382190 RepID=UPI0039BE8CC5
MKNILKLFLVFGSIVLICVVVFQLNSNSGYNVHVYKLNTGYGYEISMDSKLLIKQDHVPAIAAQHTFCNSDDALKIANLVVRKLEHKENPRITKAELDKHAIALNCLN